MNCPKCREKMTFNYKSERGRHEKIHYKCPHCGNKAMKRDKLIKNNPFGGKKVNASKGCSVPWGKNKKSRINPKKKKRRK